MIFLLAIKKVRVCLCGHPVSTQMTFGSFNKGVASEIQE
jgi:hypothetical protein